MFLPVSAVICQAVLWYCKHSQTVSYGELDWANGETISIPKDKVNKYTKLFSLANHNNIINYLNAEFMDSSNLAYMKFVDIEDLNQ